MDGRLCQPSLQPSSAHSRSTVGVLHVYIPVPLTLSTTELQTPPMLGIFSDVPWHQLRESEVMAWAKAGFTWVVCDGEHSLTDGRSVAVAAACVCCTALHVLVGGRLPSIVTARIRFWFGTPYCSCPRPSQAGHRWRDTSSFSCSAPFIGWTFKACERVCARARCMYPHGVRDSVCLSSFLK